MSVSIGNFQYEEIIEEEVPKVFKIDRSISNESLILRLLVGCIKIKHISRGVEFIQNKNFSNLGEVTENTNFNEELLNSIYLINEDVSAEDIEIYFRKNVSNRDVYNKLLHEYANFFYQTNKGCHLAAFVHLYRSLEFISYPFPLIYASKTKNFKTSFDNLKKFFGNKNDGGEIGFFKNFILALIEDEDVLDLKLNISMISNDNEIELNDNEIEEIEKIIKKIYMQTYGRENERDYEYSDRTITIPYKQFFSLIINIRNRFFHYKNGGQDNIDIDRVDPDAFFSVINNDILNWITYIFVEIYRFGVENI